MPLQVAEWQMKNLMLRNKRCQVMRFLLDYNLRRSRRKSLRILLRAKAKHVKRTGGQRKSLQNQVLGSNCRTRVAPVVYWQWDKRRLKSTRRFRVSSQKQVWVEMRLSWCWSISTRRCKISWSPNRRQVRFVYSNYKAKWAVGIQALTSSK